MSPSIRPARESDLGVLLQIEARRPTAPGWSRQQFESELSSERSYFVVLEQNGLVCGYAGFWKVPPEAQVTTLVVAPEVGGKGLGRNLLLHLLEVCRALEYEKVTLEVSSRNDPAMKLYLSAGFEVVGRRAKFYNDGSDAVLMDLRLS